ncbi:MAG: RNA polymerase sigma-70 factor [Odoribacteraceae bacterium]|nr:RNA polymerase sigma-70 factor [Odoribacteraceae bacterium]
MLASDEDTIIRLLNDGDDGGLKELFHAYYRPLCVYAMHLLDSFEESEDVVQEVFTSFWERSRREAFSGSLRAYLFSSVRNNSLRRAREKARWAREQVDEADELFHYSGDQQAREREDLDLALERLPGQCRSVFTMIVLDDMKYKEVAERLGISVNTVKTHFARALKQLRFSLRIILLLLARREGAAARG